MNGHILVVDDEPYMQRLLHALLSESGYSVECVGTTADADRALARTAYCGMVLDYQLPGEDGMVFLTRVAPHWPIPPTIIITGHDPAPLRRMQQPACVKAIMTKPFEVQSLWALSTRYFAPDLAEDEARFE